MSYENHKENGYQVAFRRICSVVIIGACIMFLVTMGTSSSRKWMVDTISNTLFGSHAQSCLVFKAETQVAEVNLPGGDKYDPDIVELRDKRSGKWGYVQRAFAPIGTRVWVYEMQPGGRPYFFREGIDYEPRPYPAKFEFE